MLKKHIMRYLFLLIAVINYEIENDKDIQKKQLYFEIQIVDNDYENTKYDVKI